MLSKNIINPDAQYILYLLDSIHSVGDYFTSLFTFSTVDFQPVRDLTLFVDLKVFNVFQFNLSIWQNVIWWVASCLVIQRLLKDIFPQLNRRTLFLIIIAFMVYPLFSQSIGWGVARKHILALFFTACLTQFWLRERDSFSLKDVCVLVFLYACSALSQAISVLWPIWALVHLLLFKPQLLKNSFKVFIPLSLIFVAMILTNYFYYETSRVFLSNASNVTRSSFNLADSILAMGHYTFQLFAPYLLVFRYTLAHWSTLVGIVILGVFAFCIRGFKVDGKWACSWALFSFLPVAMALINPKFQFDTYLLIPSLGILILLISMAEKKPLLTPRITQSLLIMASLIWMALTHLESRSWQSEFQMVKKSFERRPSCLTAGDYLKISYENEQLGSPEAKNFLYQTDCGSYGYSGKKLIVLQSLMLFYENDLPFDQKVEILKRLSLLEFFPLSVLASLYIRENKLKEADQIINEIEMKFKGVRYKIEYSPIIALYLAPYCDQKQKKECTKITESFKIKNRDIFYK